LQVGSLDSKKQADTPAPKAAPSAPQKEKVVPQAESGVIAPAPGPAAEEEAEPMDTFGSRR